MLTIALGLLVGVVLGLTGAGGGILAIPALTLGLGWTLAQATPVALLAVGTAAAVGALDGLRKGMVRYKAAALMATIGSLTSPIGLHLAGLLPATALTLMFGGLMVFVAGRMFLQARADSREGAGVGALEKNCMLNPATGRLTWNARCGLTLVSIGATSGLLTGLLSVGGGFLIVPAFRKFSDVRIHAVVSTSLMVVALVSLGTLGNLMRQGVSLSGEGVMFIAGTLGGMVAGRLIAPRLSAQWLQQGFAALCAAVALLMFAKAAMTL
ncbi:sulfite exporter TauE/SafE family protein [Pseudomonas sp.]|uniref:sulfite exporter TauE/SafE family protein n=1 Tax=Pseudomonas sp. TaxID=306 RepID=UPI0026016B65|nr:sulfite exporter TauE/SafE family protein [Pseudomonas sp.]